MEGSSSSPFNPMAASITSSNDYHDDVLLALSILGLDTDRTSRNHANNGITQVPNLSHLQGGFAGSVDYSNRYLNQVPGNSSSSINTFTEQLLNDPSSIYNQRDNLWNRNHNFSHQTPNPDYNQFQGIGIPRPGFSHEQNSNSYQGNSSGLENLDVIIEIERRRTYESVVLGAKTAAGSLYLQGILQEPNHMHAPIVIESLCLSIFEVMVDVHGKHVFDKLIDACNDYQLDEIMRILGSNEARFLDAALTENGSHSIQRMIKKIKHTSHGSTVTRLLSTQLFKLMTHRSARFIIRQCLNYLDSQSNRVIFSGTIANCMPLAAHQLGCISLNECINSITGWHRNELLSLIAEKSDTLSNDPYGNFVVQHVLDLKNEEITNKICERLQNHYIKLALKKGGSHIVERCIEFSDLGMTLAVEEILRHENSAFQLARDQFGNYVLQNALNRTKISNRRLYESLVKALEPHYADLMRNKSGRHVLHKIKDDIQLISQTTMS